MLNGWTFEKLFPSGYWEATNIVAGQLRLNWRGLWIIGGNFDGSIVCACMPGSYSRAWVDKYIPGKEGADWFYISDQRGEQ